MRAAEDTGVRRRRITKWSCRASPDWSLRGRSVRENLHLRRRTNTTMPPRIGFLLALIAAGAAAGAAFARRLERIEPARLARGYLVAVTTLIGARVARSGAANGFGAVE